MADKFIKVVLTGILICLIIIAVNSKREIYVSPANNYNDITIDNAQQFIQIAPNRIGIIDNGMYTGYKGQLIIFNFDPTTKTFSYVETLKASYILEHPEEYGIPINRK